MATWDVEAKNSEKYDDSLQQVTLQLSWLHQFQFAGYYAAIEKGFYRDAGFQVNVIEGKPGLSSVDEVVSGRANYGVGRSEILLHYLHGKPIAVLAAIMQHSAIILLAKKESDINSPQDMIGHRVMMLKGDDAAEHIAMFHNEGVSLEQIKIIPSSYDINDLIDGNTDVFNAYSTNEPYYLETKNIPTTIIRPINYGIDFYGDCLFTSEQELKRNPNQVKAFRAASLRGWKYAMAHPEEIINIIINQYEVKKTRKHLSFEANSLRKLIFPDLIQIGHMNLGRWHHMAKTYIGLGMADPKYSLKSFIYNPSPRPDYTWILWAFGVTVALSLLVGLFSTFTWFHNRRLRIEVKQRRLAEDELSKSKQKLSSHLQNTPIGALSWDLNFKVLEWNPSAEAIFGYTKEEAIGKHPIEFIFPDDMKELFDAVFQDLLSEKGGVRSTNENITKDGRRIICDWYNTVLKDVDGKVTGVASLVKDITERKQSELALISSEHKWRNILVNIPQIGVTLDTKAKIIFVNAYFLQLTGWKEQEVIGQDWFDMFIPEHIREEVRKVFLTVMSQNDTAGFSTYENEIIDRSGRLVNIAWSNALTKDVHRNVIDVTCLGVDLTERQRSQQALKKSEEKYRSMMESMKDGVYISSSEFKIEYMNPTMIDRVGEDAIGKFCYKAIYDLDEKCSWCVFDQIVQKKYVDFEIINPKDDHSYSVTNSPVVHSDGNISKLTIFHDITEIKNIQNQLQQAQKMESVGRLAGGVAHDFNNALSVIIGTTELALDDVDPTGQLHEDLDEILMAGKRAADITRQLLAFARKQTISPKVLDLNDNVGNMLKMLRRLIGEDIDLAWLPGVDPWPVKMDPTQIDQILANLCVNARDAIEGVGKVTIESGNITFNEEYCTDHIGFVPGDFVHLTVSDNGCGMDKEILDNIFEPFFTTKDVDKGTGLGLATVYGIVKQNNGFINVYSELDKGTTIKVYLPRHETEAVEIHEETTEKLPTSKGETILVVEDDSAILKIMQKVLEGLGYTVLTSGAPEKTMDIIKEYTGKIHLLITDVIMPKMNGRDLVEQLQLICPDLKYIFMSGYTADAIANQGVLDKEVNFIQKPFSRKDLAEIVRKVLDKN